ncbi:MAG: hypothetical protein KF884_10395 [Fimbriimonadaceae bacterium]|nr:hypothetical protein [Fimbriimonadaceae bacterium]QYK57955.1 MAG: hypothetical protein KF884_10395 [Fimbriimonadaceae bacterium]
MTSPTPSVKPVAGSAEVAVQDFRALRLKKALEAQKLEEAAVLRQFESKGQVVDLRA